MKPMLAILIPATGLMPTFAQLAVVVSPPKVVGQ